jgi:hypothetical protein
MNVVAFFVVVSSNSNFDSFLNILQSKSNFLYTLFSINIQRLKGGSLLDGFRWRYISQADIGILVAVLSSMKVFTFRRRNAWVVIKFIASFSANFLITEASDVSATVTALSVASDGAIGSKATSSSAPIGAVVVCRSGMGITKSHRRWCRRGVRVFLF